MHFAAELLRILSHLHSGAEGGGAPAAAADCLVGWLGALRPRGLMGCQPLHPAGH